MGTASLNIARCSHGVISTWSLRMFNDAASFVQMRPPSCVSWTVLLRYPGKVVLNMPTLKHRQESLVESGTTPLTELLWFEALNHSIWPEN